MIDDCNNNNDDDDDDDWGNGRGWLFIGRDFKIYTQTGKKADE